MFVLFGCKKMKRGLWYILRTDFPLPLFGLLCCRTLVLLEWWPRGEGNTWVDLLRNGPWYREAGDKGPVTQNRGLVVCQWGIKSVAPSRSAQTFWLMRFGAYPALLQCTKTRVCCGSAAPLTVSPWGIQKCAKQQKLLRGKSCSEFGNCRRGCLKTQPFHFLFF